MSAIADPFLATLEASKQLLEPGAKFETDMLNSPEEAKKVFDALMSGDSTLDVDDFSTHDQDLIGQAALTDTLERYMLDDMKQAMDDMEESDDYE